MSDLPQAPLREKIIPQSVLLQCYRWLTPLLALFTPLLLSWRLHKGRELRARLRERYGFASLPRPDGTLVWLHAASVGEAVSILPLVHALTERGLKILVTTGTVTSARIMAQRLPEQALHQFVPLDCPHYLSRFLHHWHPQLALLVESELWPNMLLALAERTIPTALVNARLSARSSKRWQYVLQFCKALMACLDVCLAQSEADGARLQALGAAHVVVSGNLKYEAQPLGCDAAALAELKTALGARPTILAASTHLGEEEIFIRAFQILRARYKNLLLAIAPRHPHRGDEIANLLSAAGLGYCQRSKGVLPTPDCNVYLADTIGEMGLLYQAINIVCLGNSFGTKSGGQNPIEPAQLSCAIIHGAGTRNFLDVYEKLNAAGGALCVRDETALVQTLDALLSHPDKISALGRLAANHVAGQKGALETTLTALDELLSIEGTQ